MKTNQNNKLAFYKATIAEMNEIESMNIIGGTEDVPVPTVIQAVTQIKWTLL